MTPVAAAPVEFTKSISGGANDGFSGAWGFYGGLEWYEVGNPGAPYNAWFRFTGITIPKGATILEAYLRVVETRWDSGVKLKISADASPAPTAPTSTNNHKNKVRTTASVNWNTGFADWSYHNSPDISAVIQELVDANGYDNGAIQLLVDNNGSVGEAVGRTFESGQAPRLYVKYQTGPSNHPPLFAKIGDLSVAVGKPLYIHIFASDPDGDPLTYGAENLPPGMTFDPATQTYVWPSPVSGDYEDVKFWVSDGTDTVEQLVDISVDRMTVPFPGRIVFSSTQCGDGQIYVLYGDNGNPVRLTGFGSNSHPAWSPDGSRIVFASDWEGNPEIYVMNLDGTGQTRLTSTSAVEGYPSWRPDGTKIIFVSNSGTASSIMTMNADGSGAATVATASDAQYLEPTFSPSGEFILYTSRYQVTPGNWANRLQLMRADGTGTIAITPPCQFSWGRWLPDGQHLVAICVDSTIKFQLYELKPDGSGVTLLTDELTDRIELIASPDGSALLYAVYDPVSQLYELYLEVDGVATPLEFPSERGDSLCTDFHADWWTDTNLPPFLAPIGDKTATAGVPLNFTIRAFDVNGDPLTYAATGLPSGATLDPATGVFSWPAPVAGTYNVTFAVVDGKGGADSEDITINVTTSAPAVEINKSVAASADDGMSGAWGFYNGLTWYEAGNPGSRYNAWFRFTGITIPKGATILEAYLRVVETRWDSGVKLKISADASPAPTAPTSTNNHKNKVRTTASVNWNTGFADWSYHNSPDISAVIQELVDANGYDNGAIQLLVDNNGSVGEAVGRTFESGQAPRLYIKYAVSGVGPVSAESTSPAALALGGLALLPALVLERRRGITCS